MLVFPHSHWKWYQEPANSPRWAGLQHPGELGQVELRNAHLSVDAAGEEAPSERQRRWGTPTIPPSRLPAVEMLSCQLSVFRAWF